MVDGLFDSSLTREKFDEICQPIWDKILKPIEEVLKKAGLDKSQITKVILVGGSTRIPKVRKVISNYFD